MKTLTRILAVIQAVLLVWSCAVLAEVKKEAGPRAGSFCLVGLGPGDADLLTARAVSMIRAADTVLCDSETRARLAGVAYWEVIERSLEMALKIIAGLSLMLNMAFVAQILQRRSKTEKGR